MWLVFGSFLPGVVGVSYLLRALGLAESVPAFNVALFWMGMYAVTILQFGLSRCPRCGKLFYTRGIWSNAFARKCLHCKIPLREHPA